MNKLLIVLMLVLSSLTVSANPGNSVPSAEAIAMEAEFAKIKQIYAEDADDSKTLVGGLIAFKKTCDMDWSDLGRKSIAIVMDDGGSDDALVQHGFVTVVAKIEKFGCSMAKAVVKKDETGMLFFNFK